MNIYDVKTPYGTHSVVANNIAGAEKVFLAKYWLTTIKEVRLHAEEALVDQPSDPGEEALSDMLQERIDRAVEFIDDHSRTWNSQDVIRKILTGEADR